MRREVPLVITFVVGLVFVVQYFIPHFPFNRLEGWFSEWFSIVGAFAIWLGALNLMKLSIQSVARRRGDWWYSVVVIASFLLVAVIGFSAGSDYRDPGTSFDWLYVNIYNPLSSTMYAILAFFVASASYRAFRARNLEATLLLVAAFLVMLGRVPVGDVLTGFLPEGWRASAWADAIMTYPQTAGQRAIMIGIALGIVSTALRIILGIERAHLGGD
ncbi:MAG TPA: hypothetical protein PKW75_06630 [candidate division Zixibacteria bacterium]|nr:hypothetical protein [candidate division Zixibacteria bacterium]MDD4918525.1 hypothetical protein [candidate division Zixibacteria bacterium]MDM7973395.1 hypothetical protein [candidate division Zixibacteria bacterium]HOD66894.1 hypothetical protein [candidate division Zixibacteria bacterium]HOZ07945.1 hypothetical protein [candidate division Zixibacteria bacterium]